MNQVQESAPEPLDAWHQKHGARWREIDGRREVADYGDLRSEVEVPRRGCGLFERRAVELVVVSGEDRRRFLNGYLTCDVGSLEVGAGTYGYFTSTQGRVLTDAVVRVDEDVLRVEVAAGRGPAIIEHLARYILADCVELRGPAEIEQNEATSGLGLIGAETEHVLAALGVALPTELWSWTSGEIAGEAVVLRRSRPLGVPVFDLDIEAPRAPAVAQALIAAGATLVGQDAVETLRVEAGVPRFGADFDEAHFPQEVGFEDAVSYTKGCYLGQEVVARIHYRGHVNHELRALRFESGERAAAGTDIEYKGAVVGHLGSVMASPAVGGAVGLAILHRKAAEVGTLVALGPGVTALVEESGFAARLAAESAV